MYVVVFKSFVAISPQSMRPVGRLARCDFVAWRGARTTQGGPDERTFDSLQQIGLRVRQSTMLKYHVHSYFADACDGEMTLINTGNPLSLWSNILQQPSSPRPTRLSSSTKTIFTPSTLVARAVKTSLSATTIDSSDNEDKEDILTYYWSRGDIWLL